MSNYIVVTHCSRSLARQAFSDWLDMYRDGLAKGLAFDLFGTEDEDTVIRTDQWLTNEHFNYLVNYLKYPVGIDCQAGVAGYQTILDPITFPPENMGNRVLVFIPETDTDYDCVYWVNQAGEVHLTDFGGRTKKVSLIQKFEEPAIDFDQLTLLETFST